MLKPRYNKCRRQSIKLKKENKMETAEKIEIPTELLNRPVMENGIDYESLGYEKAKARNGSCKMLQNALNVVYEKYVKKIKSFNQNQHQLNEANGEKINRLKKENERLEKENEEKKNKRIPEIQLQIERLKDEIINIKTNPQDYIEKNNKTVYYIGIVALIFLTCFLYVFYSSASYSGFFRTFNPGVNVREAMLDPQAFVNAYHDGIGELLFILCMPFIFLSLGYLIHKFNSKQNLVNYLKILLLLCVTFVFDALLAYKISEGIYSCSAILTTEEYSIKKALTEINFWAVVLCGFCTYLIWGAIFDFTVKAQLKFNQIARIVENKRSHIDNKEKVIDDEYKAIEGNNKIVADNEKEISKVGSEKPLVSIPIDEIKFIHTQFMEGWYNYLSDNKFANEIIEATQTTADYCLINFEQKHKN